jgi:non-specific serine/threonine protein kinase
LGLRLASALRDFWAYEGHSAEGLAWTQRALEKAGNAPSNVRARALNAAGWLSYEQGEHAKGKIYNTEALARFRELEDEANTAWALVFLSGQFLSLQGRIKEGRALCEEGLGLFRRLGDKSGIIFAVNVLGELARLDGDYELAGKAYEESLAIAREEGDKLRQAISLTNLGYIAYHAGAYEQAENIILEGLALQLEIENTRYIPQDLAILAGPLAGQGKVDKAALLLGASVALLEKMGLVFQAADQVEIERYLVSVQEQIGEAAFEEAWSQGQVMSLEEAVAYALGRNFDPIT